MTSYHAWTHLPKAQGGTDPLIIPGTDPWIAIFDGSTTTNGTAWMPVPFTQVAYDPALVTLGDIFDVDITDADDTGNDRFRIITNPKGVYYAELWTEWGSTATGTGYAVQNMFKNAAPNSLLSGSEHHRASADWPSELVDNPFLQQGFTVFLNQTAWTWDPYAKQTTGGSKAMNGVRLYIEYRGYSDVASWTFDTV